MTVITLILSLLLLGASERVMVAEVTAYSNDEFSINNPAWLDGRTASGKRVKEGMCAADWKHHPQGSLVAILGVGWCVVEDKGGAIKGRARFDVFKSSHKAAVQFGRRWLITVEVL